MCIANLVKTHSLTEVIELLRWRVYEGPHPHDAGWLVLFRFENRYQASVALTGWTNGIEVGVMLGDALLEVHEDLSGMEIVERLIEIMGRAVQLPLRG